MLRAIGIALIIAAAVLLIWGLQTADSIASELEEFVTGSPSEKAIYLIAGGVALLVIGLVLALRPKRSQSKP